jgi:oligopeptide/dipeptide ABC transporter ATP-binding protein
MNNQAFIELRAVKKYYPIKLDFFSKGKHFVRAVDGITLDLSPGETFGLVGESGCGKSTLGRVLLHLEKPTDGTIRYRGRDLSSFSRHELTELRAKLQLIFQDPYSSLNPRKPVSSLVGEGMVIHNRAKKSGLREKVTHYLDLVGLSAEHLDRYPHEFSGGQRQRIGIARALALEPELIVADEPVSSLDVSIQAQIINLLFDLKVKFNLTYLFISHDLSVVEHISDRVGVMYLGKIVELSEKTSLYKNPLHPYTTALFSAIPTYDPAEKRKRIILGGDIPNPAFPPTGCSFHTRCIEAKEICQKEIPPLVDKGGGRLCACHLR